MKLKKRVKKLVKQVAALEKNAKSEHKSKKESSLIPEAPKSV
jgi:hypothetical protein